MSVRYIWYKLKNCTRAILRSQTVDNIVPEVPADIVVIAAVLALVQHLGTLMARSEVILGLVGRRR